MYAFNPKLRQIQIRFIACRVKRFNLDYFCCYFKKVLKSMHAMLLDFLTLFTDLLKILLSMQQAVSRAYLQKKIGRVAKSIMDRTISNSIRFLLFDTLLYCGVLGGIHCERILFSSRYVKKSLVRYSPPQSNRRVLILIQFFSTSLRNYLNILNNSDLCFIRQTYPYLDRSSVNIMK